MEEKKDFTKNEFIDYQAKVLVENFKNFLVSATDSLKKETDREENCTGEFFALITANLRYRTWQYGLESTRIILNTLTSRDYITEDDNIKTHIAIGKETISKMFSDSNALRDNIQRALNLENIIKGTNFKKDEGIN